VAKKKYWLEKLGWATPHFRVPFKRKSMVGGGGRIGHCVQYRSTSGKPRGSPEYLETHNLKIRNGAPQALEEGAQGGGKDYEPLFPTVNLDLKKRPSHIPPPLPQRTAPPTGATDRGAWGGCRRTVWPAAAPAPPPHSSLAERGKIFIMHRYGEYSSFDNAESRWFELRLTEEERPHQFIFYEPSHGLKKTG